MRKMLVEFISTWQTLEHENVVHLLGLAILGGDLCTVEKSTENESMGEYLKDRPNANILKLVRLLSTGFEFDGNHPKPADRYKILRADWRIFTFME